MLSRLERVLVVAICVAIGWFYVWTVRSSGDPWKFGLEQRDYYNLLIDGWLDGQLHLKVEVPEALGRLKDPYDPAQRPPGLALHDATFYRGRYYLYFGTAPVLVLMLPFRLWTGIDLPLPVATLVFALGGFLTAVALWLAVRRRYFAGSGTGVLIGGILVLGLAGLWPVLLRRPHMWELPIAAGACFALLSLGCAWRSLHVARSQGTWRRHRQRAWWFGGAGLALGLAIASRPTYLLASPFLAVPLLAWWRSERQLPWRPLLSALVPLAIICGAMAWHNYARFEHPLQFGQAYQLSLDYESKMAHFRATHVPFNVWRYFFSAAEWSRAFPFIQPAALPPKPPGFGGHDDVYGLLTNLPVAWLALAVPWALWRRDRTERRALGGWLAMVAVLFAGMAGTLVCFFGSLARYQSDFAPALMLLAAVGMLALARRAEPWLRAARITVVGAMVAVAVWSALFGILYSLQLDSLLLERNPARHLEVARWWNRAPAAVERLAGVRHGPLALDLRVKPAPAGTRELLVTAGAEGQGDRCFLLHDGRGAVQVEVESVHGVRRRTAWVPIGDAPTHRLRLAFGSLLPPAAHPLLGTADEVATAALVRRLRVEWDGRVLLEESPWFAAAPGPVRVAAAGGAGTRVERFDRDEAVLAEWRAESDGWARAAAARITRRGTFRLQVSWPRDRVGMREPLLVTGRPGRGDLVAVEYGEGGTVRFLLDHWGGALVRSEPVPVPWDRPVELRIALESLRLPLPGRPPRVIVNGLVEVIIEGRRVWRVPAELFAVNPVEVAVGRNPIGGTTCGPEFTGTLHGAGPEP
ncbi:MAG: hypothetical protein HZC55_04945 [Verrucomicrobia bacterium]|nr:hypothetical protein [Verrucomicrobiota bacterium]